MIKNDPGMDLNTPLKVERYLQDFLHSLSLGVCLSDLRKVKDELDHHFYFHDQITVAILPFASALMFRRRYFPTFYVIKSKKVSNLNSHEVLLCVSVHLGSMRNVTVSGARQRSLELDGF